MELRTLRYFVTVVREGSITAAAKSLHVTQPTLSRQLAALEDELGHLLYQRNRKGIELTEQGVILRRYAESILALADKAEEEIAREKKKAVNEIKDEISDLAVMIATKVVGKDLNTQDHEQLIQEFIDGAGDLSWKE